MGTEKRTVFTCDRCDKEKVAATEHPTCSMIMPEGWVEIVTTKGLDGHIVKTTELTCKECKDKHQKWLDNGTP